MSQSFKKNNKRPNNDGMSDGKTDPVAEVIDPVVTEDDLVNDPEVIAEHNDGDDNDPVVGDA